MIEKDKLASLLGFSHGKFSLCRRLSLFLIVMKWLKRATVSIFGYRCHLFDPSILFRRSRLMATFRWGRFVIIDAYCLVFLLSFHLKPPLSFVLEIQAYEIDHTCVFS